MSGRSPRQNADLYELPALYDIVHTPGTADEVDGLEMIALAYCRTDPGRGIRAGPSLFSGRTGPVWLEPACGTGRYLRTAAARGVGVVGFDSSVPAIRYAQRRLRRAGLDGRSLLFVGDMTDFAGEVPARSVDFAFNLINTIRHLPSDDAVLAHFAQMARVLKRGGVYVVGISTSAYGAEFPTEDVWSSGRGRCRVQQTIQYIPPPVPATPGGRQSRVERVISHLTVTRPRGVQHIDSRYTLRCYSRRQWRGLIGRSPLRLVAVVNEYGDEIEVAEAGYGIYVLGVR